MISATVIGNLGAEAELKYLPDGTAVLELRMASNSRENAGGGEWKDVPTWVRVAMFGKRAESLAKLNLTKGTKLAARGAMKLREFDKKDGGKGFSLEMRADDVELLGGGAGREPGKDAAPKYGTSGAGANAKHTAPSDDEEIPF